MHNGKLITIEGINGCGRTTQLHKLAEHLIDEGLTVLCMREALPCKSADVPQDYEVLVQALKAGCTVLAEGFFDCNPKWNDNVPDFGFKHFVDRHEGAGFTVKPDLTFVLELEVKDAWARAPANYPTLLSQATESWLGSDIFYEKTQATWIEIATQSDWPVHLISADRSIPAIHRQIVYHTRKMLNLPTFALPAAYSLAGPEDYERQFQVVQAVRSVWDEAPTRAAA